MTATIDWAQTWQKIRLGLKYLYSLEKELAYYPSSDSLVKTYEDAMTQDGVPLDSDLSITFASGLSSVRAQASSLASVTRFVLDPLVLELGRVIGRPQTDPLAVLPWLYDYMAQNQGSFASPPRVSSRNITRGSWTAGGSNVGTGTVYRLTVDRYGFPLESGITDATTRFQCLQDANSGTNVGEEVFSVQGLPLRDAVSRYQPGYGSGINLTDGLKGISGTSTANLVQNPSFASSTGTGASFALNNWTLASGVASSMSVSTLTADVFRPCSIESTPGALKCTGSVTITQLISTNGGKLGQTLAYLSRLMVNRSNYAGSGTITVQIGSKSWSVVLAAQTGYVALMPALDKNLYFSNFNTANLAVTITITVTGGGLLIDDFNWAPQTNLNGTCFWAFGGATAWLYNDTGTITDAEDVTVGNGYGVIQRAFSEAYGWCLPAIVMGTAATAATLVQSATAGVVSQGAHQVYVAFVTAAGDETPCKTASAIIAFDGAHRADLTGIPVGPGGTTARRVYATEVQQGPVLPTLNTLGVPAASYLALTIADNVTTTGNFSLADASLGTPAAAIADPT